MTGTIDYPRALAIAEVCHEANRVLQRQLGEVPNPMWSDCPEELQKSAVLGVKTCVEQDATPEELHEAWTVERRRNGWVYGEIKDPVAKTHPCLVPYAELPPQQRLKDHLFAAIVNALKE